VGKSEAVFTLLILAAGWLAAPAILKADIYVYRDKDGVRHFTNVPTSPDYRIYIRHDPKKRLSVYSTDEFDTHIYNAAQENELAFALVKAIIKVESDFDPRAVSRAGAKGLMQIMPQNYASLGLKDPFDPYENIKAGSRYFRQLLDRFDGELSLTLAAYNAGPSIVDRYKTIPPYPETQDYVDKVMKYYDQFSR
jgi:soluble lytic murein transglycosylase